MVDSSFGSTSEAGSESESAVGPGSALSVSYVLGMQADSDYAHSVTEEYFLPTIFQSTVGSFQNYNHWLHHMYTTHKGTPFDNAQISHKCNTRLIHDLVLLLDL